MRDNQQSEKKITVTIPKITTTNINRDFYGWYCFSTPEYYRVRWSFQTNKNRREFSGELAAILLATTHF